MELPIKRKPLGPSPAFDRQTVPQALLSRHALGHGRWAQLQVLAGSLVFVDLDNDRKIALTSGESHVVEPELAHRVELADDARFQLEFFREDG